MIEFVAWALLLPPAVATLVLTIELIAAQWPVRRAEITIRPRIAIIVPAHDEAAGIEATVTTLRNAAPGGTRLVVVADNCGDATAALARSAGAEVIERDEPQRRGKGFALAFARDRLAADPPGVAIVVDADCSISGGGMARLAAAAQASGRPVQSAYMMRPRPDLGTLVGLSGLAFLMRNLVRQRGLARLGAPALLTGSGMAFRWDVFASAPLATADMVEDLSLGIALARIGQPPLFLPDTATWSEPAARHATMAQRTRWEHGFLRTARRAALPLLAERQWPLIWLGLHLLVPPLALLVVADGATLLLLFALARAGSTALPFIVLMSVLTAAVLLLGISWARFGRAQISGGSLLLIPFYILWKMPIYLGALLRPERRWIRTKRN